MAWRASEFDNSGTASGILRSRLNETQDRSWTGSCVDGLDGTTLCMSRKQFSSEGHRENALSFYPLCHLEKCAWGETIQKMEPS